LFTENSVLMTVLPTEKNLTADRLAQYVKRNRCERFLRFSLFKSEADKFARRYGVRFETLSPLLAESGQSYEREVVSELEAEGGHVKDLVNKPSADFLDTIAAQIEPKVFYYQAKLASFIGQIECEGIADLILVEKTAADAFNVCVIDIKSSRRETTGYRLQVAFYARLLEEMFTRRNWTINNLTGAIHLKGKTLSVDTIDAFELGLYADEIERLVATENSDVVRVVKAAFADTTYHLNYNCDGCRFNAACFVQAAETEDLSLIPQLTATEKLVLKTEGYGTLRKVAALFEYRQKEMVSAETDSGEAERLNKNWALSGKLPVIAQRARAALHRFDKTIEFRSFVVGSDFGTLPDTSRYPELVRVFIDTQHDYLNDRLYMFSAVVAGAARSREICEIAAAPPDDECEQQLLISGVQKVLQAIAETADSTHAPVHFYLFDRRSQESLKAALTRHFAVLCAIPAFYDLLTASPTLSQPMISFLADDVAARRNLKNLGQNLYQVAGEMKFDWAGERKIKERFRAKIFDNFRKYSRSEDGGEFAPAESGSTDARDVWIEASARFGTEIPLEYVYAAWGELEAPENVSDAARMQLEGFLGTTIEELRELAILRCRALQYIEESFGYKNREIEKQELNLTRLHEVEIEPEEVPLTRAIEDFLYLEHHARRQEAYLFFAFPPDVRAASGRCAVIRNEELREENKALLAEFSFSDVRGNTPSAVEQKMLRFREGDWVVLNELRNENGKFPSAKSIVTGRLAIVEKVGEEKIVLRLSSMCKASAFRYAHRLFKPVAGKLYTIDQMLDDFNSDKFLLACRQAELTNPLYRWLSDAEEGKQARLIRPSRKRTAQTIAALANKAQQPHNLTAAQEEIIGNLLEEKAFVLQGPPGTGKSHTLGFAVLARILALKVQGKPLRVAISAKTHSAVKIALGSIAKRAKILKENISGEPILAPLENLKVYKLCHEMSEQLPDGVTAISPDGDEDIKAAAQWDKLENEDILIIGGTPGMLYNLIKRGANRGKTDINWAAQYFDLVVVDEASQMGLAEALTAAAFLKSDGQFIAIGDHRQMPPILAHAWDRESRRDLEKIKPHLSIFEFLKESGFRVEALDESFRIPAEVAEFLDAHIYTHDGVKFHSKNKQRIDRIESFDEAWLAAVFAPEHPLVLLEHGESQSAHANEFEADLVEKIIRLAKEKLNLDEKEGIGIVVPHRAQKALLQMRLPHLADSIDTVERFQGGERDLIIVSATVSSRDFAAAEMEFLLDPRRLTVAISRPKRKIIVVASQTVFNLIPSNLDDYERGALWKHLARDCRQKTLWQGEISNHGIKVCAK